VVNWINTIAAQFVAHKLQPYVDELIQIIPNSMQIARDIRRISSFSLCLMTCDVSDMYNSIDQELCLKGLEKLARKKGWWTTSPYTVANWERILVLCRWVFETSYVGYGNQVYKQKRGLPMGSPLSPVLANLYMAWLEENVIFDEAFNEIIYVRYLDDVLLISGDSNDIYDNKMTTHAKIEEMETLLELITFQSNESIEFERIGVAYHPEQLVEFLDLEITIGRKKSVIYGPLQELIISVYDKPTNLHIYTDPSTFYPFHYVYNWIQGENIRYIPKAEHKTELSRNRHRSRHLQKNC
jgi:hypothetical protein